MTKGSQGAETSARADGCRTRVHRPDGPARLRAVTSPRGPGGTSLDLHLAARPALAYRLDQAADHPVAGPRGQPDQAQVERRPVGERHDRERRVVEDAG